MTMKPRNYRPESPEQLDRLDLLTLLFAENSSQVIRRAIDALYEQHAEAIDAIRPQWEAVKQAQEAAQQAAEAVRG